MPFITCLTSGCVLAALWLDASSLWYIILLLFFLLCVALWGAAKLLEETEEKDKEIQRLHHKIGH